jgi:signal transduction histidine kinase
VVEDRLELERPSELRVVLYRMAQEALNNVHKHADAKTVHVLLEHRRGGYLLRINDDGVGFTAPASLRSERGHLGLTSMRERAAMAGGTCRLESLPGAGTTVEFWVPQPGASLSASEPASGDIRRTAVPA